MLHDYVPLLMEEPLPDKLLVSEETLTNDPTTISADLVAFAANSSGVLSLLKSATG